MNTAATLPAHAGDPGLINVDAPARSQVVGSALAVAALGVALLWGVGFAQVPAVHNAAHDTRHSNGFPCH